MLDRIIEEHVKKIKKEFDERMDKMEEKIINEIRKIEEKLDQLELD